MSIEKVRSDMKKAIGLLRASKLGEALKDVSDDALVVVMVGGYISGLTDGNKNSTNAVRDRIAICVDELNKGVINGVVQ